MLKREMLAHFSKQSISIDYGFFFSFNTHNDEYLAMVSCETRELDLAIAEFNFFFFP